jgi:hypothetical protein
VVLRRRVVVLRRAGERRRRVVVLRRPPVLRAAVVLRVAILLPPDFLRLAVLRFLAVAFLFVFERRGFRITTSCSGMVDQAIAVAVHI